jgi:hypothetical protein
MASLQHSSSIDICERSSPEGIQSLGLQRRGCKHLALCLVLLSGFPCSFSFAGPSVPDPGVGLFLRSPTPILPQSVVAQLKRGMTQISIGIAFDGSGNVREAHVTKSSGVPAADEVVRKWIEARWKARPEVVKAGFYKGSPLNSTEFTLPMVLDRR